MVLSRTLEPPNLVVLTLAGVVTASDQADLVNWVRDSIRLAGTVRVLVVLEQFAGWNPRGVLDNRALWLRDDDAISKMAIVGEAKWKASVFTVIAQPIRRTPIAYFQTEEDARRWLQLNPEGTTPALST